MKAVLSMVGMGRGDQKGDRRRMMNMRKRSAFGWAVMVVGVGMAFDGAQPEALSAAALVQSGQSQSADEELYRAARRALNEANFQRAAELFEQLRREHPQSRRIPASYYYEAYALGRFGDPDAIARATRLLQENAERIRASASAFDVEALLFRLQSMSARAELEAELDEEAVQELRQMAALVQAQQLEALRINEQQIEAAVEEAARRQEVAAAQLRELEARLRDQDALSREELEATIDAIRAQEEQIRIEVERILRESERGEEMLRRSLSEQEAEEIVRQQAQMQRRLDEALQGIERAALLSRNRLDDERIQEILESTRDREVALSREIQRVVEEWNRSGRSESLNAEMEQLVRRLEQAEVAAELAAAGSVCGPALRDSRSLALSEAVRMGASAAVESLIEILKAPNECGIRERRDAALLLFSGDRGRNEASVSDLRDIFRVNPDTRIRELVVWDLVQRENRQAVTLLIEIAREEEGSVSELAIYGLTRSDDSRAQAFLREIGRGG